MIRRGPCLFLASFLLLSFCFGGLLSLASAATGEEETKSPVFFVPLRVSKDFAKEERTLRQALAASLLGTGKFSEAVSAETSKRVQACVRSVNTDENREQCWVRIGGGAGADLMVDGEIRGTRRSCSVSVKLTVLETRVSTQRSFGIVKPCGLEELVGEMVRAAGILAGTPASPRRGGTVPTSTVAPPIMASTGPRISGGSVTAATGNLAIEVKPFGATRLDITPPGGEAFAVASPYRNPKAPLGTWTFKATSRGLEATERSISVRPDETTLVQLQLKAFGSLAIVGKPEGAAVNVSGPGGFEDRRGLPWTAEGLPSGRYKVEVTRAGYEPFTRRVDISAGDSIRVPVQLRRINNENGKSPRKTKQTKADRKRVLSRNDISKVVRENKGRIKLCYTQQTNKKLSGTIMMRFTIVRSGRTSSVSIRTPKFKSTPVGDCVLAVVKSMTFPKHNSSPVKVTYPFILR